jgi:LDH2 family malate/lactate/ureidoglycolate dehydrogenase
MLSISTTTIRPLTNTGHVIVAINIAMFRAPAEFKRGVDELIRDIRGSKRLPGIDAIRLPGEQSHAKREQERNTVFRCRRRC